MILSSATEAIIFLSLKFQDKSETLAVWPPCINIISGGPSFISSGVCSLLIFAWSHTMILLSDDPDANKFSWWGWNLTTFTSSWWALNTWTETPSDLLSHKATDLSTDPVRIRFSLNGLKSIQSVSSVWQSTACVGSYCLVSQRSIFLSSPTDPKIFASCLCQQTSSTSASCLLNSWIGDIYWPFICSSFSMSHKQILWSSDPESNKHCYVGFQESPYPSFECPFRIKSGFT